MFSRITQLLFLVVASYTANAQYLFTTSNKCFHQIQEADAYNNAGKYADALSAFEAVLKKCSAKDAKEQANVGLAIASNGLREYNSAIGYANAAIKVSKKKNVMAYYARSYAYQQIGSLERAREDIATITQLTTKNKNTKSRATMFAQLANLDDQLNRVAQADSNLAAAIALDPTNPNFYFQQGDRMVKQGNYPAAYEAYDKVVELGKKDLEIYQTRTEVRLKQMQEKYNTTDSKRLAQLMTRNEQTLLCHEINQAIALGLKNMQLELLATMICE